MKIQEINEFALIERIKPDSIVNPERVVQGIGDDAAVEKISGEKYLLSACDMLIEDIHFLRNCITPWQLGYKAIAVNFSDIAAVGGKPTGVLASLGLPGDVEVAYVDEFFKGLKSLCSEYKVNLLGGDIVRSPFHIVVNVTVLGEVTPNMLILRSGAKISDVLLVTGTVGDSKAGLELLMRSDQKSNLDSNLLSKHLTPKPPVEEGVFLAAQGVVTSMNDISDGLSNEISEIADASSVGAKIYAHKIPISAEAKKIAYELDTDVLDWALYGGEDYQLVITCKKGEQEKLKKNFKEKFKKELFEIGEITSSSEGIVMKRNEKLEIIEAKGYSHFK